MKPSPELLREWFDYIPETGALIRKKKLRFDLSDIVPVHDRIYFQGKRYTYSHIVWVIYYGKWPEQEIDHKNLNDLDNRIDNLREATRSENGQNRRCYNSKGKGVAFDDSVYRTKPYLARISVNGKSIFLGSFATKDEAAEAYRQAALKYHGEFACLE